MVTLLLSTAALVLLTALGAGALLCVVASSTESDKSEEAERATRGQPSRATATKPESAASDGEREEHDVHARQRCAIEALSSLGVDDLAPIFAALLAPAPTRDPLDTLAMFAVTPMVPAEVQALLRHARTLRLVSWAETPGWTVDACDAYEIAMVGAATWLDRRLRHLRDANETDVGSAFVILAEPGGEAS